MSERPYRNADWLDAKYWKEGLTQEEIADEAGVCVPTIATWMKKLGVESRPNGCDKKSFLAATRYKDADWIKNKYWDEGLTQLEIGKIAGVAAATVGGWMRDLDIPVRNYDPVDREKYRSAAWLQNKYWNEGLTQQEMAEIAGVTNKTISQWMREVGVETPSRSLPKGRAAENQVFRHYVLGAERRGIEWDLERDHWKQITQRPCFYCGAPPSNETGSKRYNGTFVYNGIDRVDPDKGYEEGNVVSCCQKCNVAKHDMSLEEFRQWAKNLSSHFLK